MTIYASPEMIASGNAPPGAVADTSITSGSTVSSSTQQSNIQNTVNNSNLIAAGYTPTANGWISPSGENIGKTTSEALKSGEFEKENTNKAKENISAANRLLPSIMLKLEGKIPLTGGETYESLFKSKQTLEGAKKAESEYSGVDASFGYNPKLYSGLEAFGAYYEGKQAQVTPELAFQYSTGKVQMDNTMMDVSREFQSKYTMPSFNDYRQRAISLDIEAITGTQGADRGYFITPKEGGGAVGLLAGSKMSYFNIFERGVKEANRTGNATYIGGLGITWQPTNYSYGSGIINETAREIKSRGYNAEEGRQFEMVNTFGKGEHPIKLNIQTSLFGRTRMGILGAEGRPPLLTTAMTGYIINTNTDRPFGLNLKSPMMGGFPEPENVTQSVMFNGGGMAIYEKSKTEAWQKYYSAQEKKNSASSFVQPTDIERRVTDMGAFVEGLPGLSFLHERASISQAYAAKHPNDIAGNFMRELGQGVILYPESTAKLLIATGGLYATFASGDFETYRRGVPSVRESYAKTDYPKLVLTSAIFAGLGVRRTPTYKPFEIEASVAKGSIEVEQGVMRAKYDVSLRDVMQPNKATAGSGFVALKGNDVASSVFHPLEFTKGKTLFGSDKIGFSSGKAQFSVSSIVQNAPRTIGIAFEEGKNVAYKVQMPDESLVQRQSLGGVVGKKGSTETYVRDIFRKDIMKGNQKIGEEYTSLVAVKQGRGYRQGIMRTRFPFDEQANLVGGQGGSFQKYVQVMKLAKQTKLVQETIFKSVTSQIEVPSEGGLGQMGRIGVITVPKTTTRAFTTTKPVTITRPYTAMRSITSMRSVTTSRPVTSMRSIISFRPITTFRAITSTRATTSMRPTISMRSIVSSRPVTSLRSITTTRPITTVRPMTSLRSITSLRPVTTFNFKQPPNPPPIIGKIELFPTEKSRGRKGKGKRGSRKYGYTPSLTAGIFNISGKVSSSILSGKRQISGLELRPLVRGGKTKYKMGRFR